MPTLFRLLILALLLRAAQAQEVREQPLPFSAWLDLSQLTPGETLRAALPIWLESVRRERSPRVGGEARESVYRLRLRKTALYHNEVQLRLFYKDAVGAAVHVRGWTEIGQTTYDSGALGEGLMLDTSETLVLPVRWADYVEITTKGPEGTIRGVFVSPLTHGDVRFSADFGQTQRMEDPFGGAPKAQPSAEDTRLLGRVKATLQAESYILSAKTPAEWSLGLQAAPVLALLTFEVLHPDMTFLPEVQVNGSSTGAVTVQWPDLADPGYQGQIRPRERDARFHYEGWVRCQKVISSSKLRAGQNELRISLSRASGEVAIRNLELQLKQPSAGLEFLNAP